MVTQTITPAQLPGAMRQIAEEAVSPKSWKRTLLKCRVAIAADIKKNFRDSRTPDGQAWPPLKYRKGKPLRDKGILMASVTSNGPGHVERITDSSLTFGTNVRYAKVHNFGATIKAKMGQFLAFPIMRGRKVVGIARVRQVVIPKREFIGISPRLADQLVKIIGDDMEAGNAG